MFTGIVTTVGRIARIQALGGDTRLTIAGSSDYFSDVALGDSISVAGVCLTAVQLEGDRFAADVSVETLTVTTLGTLREGDPVNLEKALRLADRLGGHLVSGHVDGVGKIISITPDARSLRWVFEVPKPLSRYTAVKGSVCIDGVSLTVNEVDGVRFGVNLIPHTLQATTFGARQVGDTVNIEVDLVARYLERLHAKEGE